MDRLCSVHCRSGHIHVDVQSFKTCGDHGRLLESDKNGIMSFQLVTWDCVACEAHVFERCSVFVLTCCKMIGERMTAQSRGTVLKVS